MLFSAPETLPYRHEYKYVIDPRQMELLKLHLSAMLTLDPHTGPQGKYDIRSLYFDDFRNSCYYENENGTDPREKFRIRIYNHSDRRISLELKRKEADKTHKTACRIDRGQVERLMAGQNLIWDDAMDPLLKKFYVLVENRGMAPKVIVDYQRIPYICRDGNVRVTLDHNICTSAATDRFFEADIFPRPIMPTGQNLMEVKFDQFLPDYIYRTLQLSGLRRSSYSKYYLCRKFGGIL